MAGQRLAAAASASVVSTIDIWMLGHVSSYEIAW
jgi:hypothetical protein